MKWTQLIVSTVIAACMVSPQAASAGELRGAGNSEVTTCCYLPPLYTPLPGGAGIYRPGKVWNQRGKITGALLDRNGNVIAVWYAKGTVNIKGKIVVIAAPLVAGKLFANPTPRSAGGQVATSATYL